jgi:hypothetical protein
MIRRTLTFAPARAVTAIGVVSVLMLFQVGLGTAQASPGETGTGPSS